MTRLLRAGDDRYPALVCAHPVSGEAADYAGLARALAWPGPVRGLDAPAPAAIGTFAELARHHADQLDVTRPVLLLGWSMGGVLAAELARLVVERGGEVGFLGLLDSRAPQPEMRTRPTDDATLARFFLHQRALTREVEPAPPPAAIDPATLLAALRGIGAADGLADEAALAHRLATFKALVRAFFHHEQRFVPTPLHLFETAEAHPSHPRPATLGWDDLAVRVDKRVIGGTHFSLLGSSRVAALARTIDACLPAAMG